VPAGLAEHTITLEYNNAAAVEQVCAEIGDQIACVIVEPIAGNMNMVPPVDGFLETLSKQCQDAGALLILDEVMTGFRVAKGGAQQLFGIHPDLTTIGKVIGGGLPAAAFGGRADIMASIAPDGPVYQAGTLSGNPLAMAAGIATLEQLEAAEFFNDLGATTRKLADGLASLASDAGIPLCVEASGGMFGFVFSDDGPIRRFSQVVAADVERFKKFFHGMLDHGIYLAPSAFETGFVSSAHGDDEISQTLDAAQAVFKSL
jgi:glutamate-1-semialdehyde 2,1-aminomutase